MLGVFSVWSCVCGFFMCIFDHVSKCECVFILHVDVVVRMRLQMETWKQPFIYKKYMY